MYEKCLHAEVLTQGECTLGQASFIWYAQVLQGKLEHLHEHSITYPGLLSSLSNPSVGNPFFWHNNKRTSFSNECSFTPRASQDVYLPCMSPSPFKRQLVITAGLHFGEALPLQLSLICLTSSEKWFTCLSPKVVFSKNHSKMITCKLSSW